MPQPPVKRRKVEGQEASIAPAEETQTQEDTVTTTSAPAARTSFANVLTQMKEASDEADGK